MTPEKIYQGLGLLHPLIFERHTDGPIGSTTHMLVEAVMDYYALEDRRVPRSWYIVIEKPSDITQGQRVFEAIRKFLRRGKVPEFVFLTPEKYRTGIFLHPKCNPMIYVDHQVLSPDRRVTGPYRMVRAVKTNGSRFNMVDREQRLIAEATPKGVDDFLALASCPIFDDRRGLLVQGGKVYGM